MYGSVAEFPACRNIWQRARAHYRDWALTGIQFIVARRRLYGSVPNSDDHLRDIVSGNRAYRSRSVRREWQVGECRCIKLRDNVQQRDGLKQEQMLAKIVDLSVEIFHQMPCHQALVRPIITDLITHERSAADELGTPDDRFTSAIEFLSMITHTGTHVDAPYHFGPDRRDNRGAFRLILFLARLSVSI